MAPLCKFILCLLAFDLFESSVQGQIITTIAGDGVTQYIGDGYPATIYSLGGPKSVCVDKKGAVYDADFYNNRIRKVYNDTLYTIAGIDTPGYSGDNGPASAAKLDNPDGIAMDTAGNFYITEFYNEDIRKIDAHTHIITTICGSESAGYSGDGGPATAAKLQSPYAACSDPAGNLYIPDYANHRIRKYNAATGYISTFAGTGTPGYSGDNGPANEAKLFYPSGVCLDNAGNLYISEFGNNTIRKVDHTTGIITTIAGTTTASYTGDGGPAATATLNEPNSVFVDRHGYVYISDFGNNVIRAIHPNGSISTIAGNGSAGYSGDGGPATNATFRGPTSVFVDDSLVIYIADGDNSVIRKVTKIDTFTDSSISHVGVNDVTPVIFTLYPNPSSGRFTVFSPEVPAEAMIEIYNAVGQCVYKTPVLNRKTEIDLDGMSKGMYMVQYLSQAGRDIRKVIIQ